MDTLEIRDLSFTYAGAETPALTGVSLRLGAGDFALLTGATGCGKSTLLRLIRRELAPRGTRTGSILFRGRETERMSPRDEAAKIGFVLQRTEEQIVTDRVWHELAFGMENLGIPEAEMRRRVAETAQFFGLENLFDRGPDQLSGGQRQILNLAAATATEPELLLLDEPTARLDPIAAKNFLAAVERLNRETGMTILMAEHRLEDSLSRASRLILMDRGHVTDSGEPREVCGRMPSGGSLEGALPGAARLWRICGRRGSCPLNTGEGRNWAAAEREAERGPEPAAFGNTSEPGRDRPESEIRKEPDGTNGSGKDARNPESRTKPGNRKGEAPEPALRMREVWFRFSRDGQDVLRSLNLEIRPGEIFALLGGNGSGKTTLLRAAAGLITPYSGEIRLFGKRLRDYRHGTLRREGAAMLPQDVQTLFLRPTVREELRESGIPAEAVPKPGEGAAGFSAGFSGKAGATVPENRREDVFPGAEELLRGLSGLMDRHPYDLSGGEQQLLGLAKVLAGHPRLLMLDEPTGGLDAEWRAWIQRILRDLRREGVTVLMATHDAEFAAEAADRCGLLFRGRVEAMEEPHLFFAGSSYYTPPVSRMVPGCITLEEAAKQMTQYNTEATFREGPVSRITHRDYPAGP